MCLILVFILSIIQLLNVRAEETPWYSYQSGIFHITYQTEGIGAVPITDVNKNGIPDRIEDIGTQLEASRVLFHQVLCFPDPLESQRYKGNVAGVEVIIKDRNIMGGHGRAFNKSTYSRFDPKVKTLKIHVSSDTDPRRNPTPTHEYFHLIQYGQSRFMNGWYLEGMARWSEDAINRVRVDSNVGIDTEKAVSTTYAAAKSLWHPLGTACEGQKQFPSWLVQKYRYVDDTPIFKDDRINGPETMRNVLTCLHEKEVEAAENFGGVPLWRKNGQRSPQNDPFILECVRAKREQCAR